MEEKPKYELAQGRFLAMASTMDLTSQAIPSRDLAIEIQVFKALAQLFDWPAHFPASCPPAAAKPDDFLAFRLVSNSPPAREDFASHVVAKKPYRPAGHCLACGLSVFRNLNDVKATRTRFKPLRGMMIARGHIHAGDGVVMQTGTCASHYTWWVKTAAPEACFLEVEPE